jgi:hypothetical protein
MILKAHKYLFYFFYKMTSVNYGREGGAHAAYIIISIFFSMNALTLIGLCKKLILKNFNISLLELSVIFVLMLVMSFLIFIYKSRYKKIVSDFNTYPQKDRKWSIMVVFYIIITFVTLVAVIKL